MISALRKEASAPWFKRELPMKSPFEGHCCGSLARLVPVLKEEAAHAAAEVIWQALLLHHTVQLGHLLAKALTLGIHVLGSNQTSTVSKVRQEAVKKDKGGDTRIVHTHTLLFQSAPTGPP